MLFKTAELSLFSREDISDLLSVVSKVLFSKLLDSLTPNTGEPHSKRAKEKPAGAPPTVVLGHEGSWLCKGNCFMPRLFGCFEQWASRKSPMVGIAKQIPSLTEQHLQESCSEQAKGSPCWLA